MNTAGTNTPQSTATAAADHGSASATAGTTATNNAPIDSFDAALEAALGGSSPEAGQNGTPTDAGSKSGAEAGAEQTSQAGAATGGEGAGQGAGHEGEGAATSDNAPNADGSAELPETIDPETPPKGLENVPKAVWQRIQKQSATIRDLKEQMHAGGITLAPTPLTPLANVFKPEDLQREIQSATAVRQWLAPVKDTDFTHEGTDGVMRAEVVIGKQRYLLSADEVADKLGYADSVLDKETLDARQKYITDRAAEKPWDVAETILPGMLTKGTPTHDAYVKLLERMPELPVRLPNFEVIAAHILRGEQMAKDEKEGKAKWVRHELDKDGKFVAPKKAADTKLGGTPAVKDPPAAPTGAKPPVAGSSTRKATEKEVLASKAKATPEQRLDALLEAQLG